MVEHSRQMLGTASAGRAVVRTRELHNLRWLATFAPAVAIFVYETLRHSVIEHHVAMPEAYGNVLTGGLALVLSFWFSRLIFASVARIQEEAIAESSRTAALRSVIEERERLSRELHDGLAQVVSYVLMRLDTVRNLVEVGKASAAVEELEHLRAAVDDVNADVRDSIAGLRSRVLERGLVPALVDYVDEFDERCQIEAQFEADADLYPLAPQVSLQLFRIAQEALSNVRKHSHAERVAVRLENQGERVELTIVDTGTGFDVQSGVEGERTFGIASMRERAWSCGGSCTITSGAAGTKVTVLVPRVATP